MTARSRTFFFPGGMLQVAAYDDDDEDNPGVYLQLHDCALAAGRAHGGTDADGGDSAVSERRGSADVAG
ncbi:hypothetical protein [Nocardia terpenica]|uniref:hypothetical protein n=1 Tax=Nocardia terpenica TaxID=455432 RepID=UPI0002DBEE02|nr:hypothetical protein [Nocardia terpenica]NQE93424.1 hypothetical protein [Nocardia terpenica]